MRSRPSAARWTWPSAPRRPIITDLAVIDLTPQGLKVLDIVDGLSLAELQRLTGVPLSH